MAILIFLLRIRLAVLALLALATAVAAYLAFASSPVPVGALFLGSASFVIAAIAAFVYLRHAGLAVLTALAPLPGLLAAGPFALHSGLPIAGLLAGYGFGYCAAACLGGDVMRRILDGESPPEASRATLAGALVPAAGSVLIAAGLILGWLFVGDRMLAVTGVSEIAAAVLSSLVFVPFAAAALPFGEPYFVTANRARERREAWLRLGAKVLEPRWGMSVSGIALVLATLGWFGAEPFVSRSALLAQPPLWGAAVLAIFLVALAVGRDWREALAATLTLSVLALLSVWLRGKAGGHVTAGAFLEIAATMAVCLFAVLSLIDRGRRWRHSGDTPAIARLRALESFGLAPWLGTVGAAAAIAPWLLLHGSVAVLGALLVLAGGAGLVIWPALATALDSLVPRRRSLGELYGRG